MEDKIVKTTKKRSLKENTGYLKTKQQSENDKQKKIKELFNVIVQ